MGRRLAQVIFENEKLKRFCFNMYKLFHLLIDTFLIRFMCFNNFCFVNVEVTMKKPKKGYQSLISQSFERYVIVILKYNFFPQ